MPRFEWPWALLALAFLPILARISRRRIAPAIPFNRGLFGQAPLPISVRQRFLPLPRVLRLVALALLIVAVARPQLGAHRVRDIGRSIGIQILADRSGSMGETDMLYHGRLRSRLDVVKAVAADFIFGDSAGWTGRPADMIGIIAFSSDPVTLCPLTLSHEHLRPALESLTLATGDDNGTAIGDAVALAAARFRAAEADVAGGFKSKVIVLLTDGENNQGARTETDAAKLARSWGVRIYAIGIRPGAYARQDAEFGLQALAVETDGLAETVNDGASLRSVFEKIAALEPTDLRVTRYTGGVGLWAALIFGALCMTALEAVLNQTWLRRIP